MIRSPLETKRMIHHADCPMLEALRRANAAQGPATLEPVSQTELEGDFAAQLCKECAPLMVQAFIKRERMTPLMNLSRPANDVIVISRRAMAAGTGVTVLLATLIALLAKIFHLW